MGRTFLIRNATIVNEGRSFRGDVYVENGLIADVSDAIPLPTPGIPVYEAAGKLLLPGIIDDQVHFREPGLTQKGDLLTESRAAVAGGVTSFMDMPNTTPKAVTLDILEEKYRLASGKSLANYSFFLGATNGNIAEIRKVSPEEVCGVKVFMGASTGNMLVDDPAALEAIFSECPVIVAIHSEDETVIRRRQREIEVLK